MTDFDIVARIYKEADDLETFVSKRKKVWLDQGSPFASLLPSYSIQENGTLGEYLLSRLAKEHGYNMLSAQIHNDAYDLTLVIDNATILLEQKFATESISGNARTYTANQIRQTGYDYFIIMGLNAVSMHFWVFPKTVIWQHTTSFQHGVSTKQLAVRIPNNRHRWYDDYYMGGSLKNVVEYIRKTRNIND